MSHDKADTRDLARHLATACNEHAQAHDLVGTVASPVTMETVSGYAFMVSSGGYDYTVLVARASSPVFAEEFREYPR